MHIARGQTAQSLNLTIGSWTGADRTRSGERLASATSDSARAPSWKHGNPYEKPFPRARIWTPKDLAGLSGEHPPPGWMTRAEREQEEAMLLAKEKENDISAKDLYAQLVLAAACARKERLLDLAGTYTETLTHFPRYVPALNGFTMASSTPRPEVLIVQSNHVACMRRWSPCKTVYYSTVHASK